MVRASVPRHVTAYESGRLLPMADDMTAIAWYGTRAYLGWELSSTTPKYAL